MTRGAILKNRALALLEDDCYYWIWIGTHAEYNQILKGQ